MIRDEDLSDSEAVRAARREAAARCGTRSSIAAEVALLAADEADRAEMRAIRDQMAAMAPYLSARDSA